MQLTSRTVRTILLLLGLCLAFAAGARAQEALKPLVDGLGATAFPQKVEAVKRLAATGDPKVPEILEKLSAGALFAPKAGGAVYLVEGDVVSDPVTGASVEGVAAGSLQKIRLNNMLRGAIGDAMSQLTLLSPDRNARLSAAQALLASGDTANLALLDGALAKESDPEVKAAMDSARAVLILKTDASAEDKKAAIENVAARGDRGALNILSAALATAPPDLVPVIQGRIDGITSSLAVWDVLQNVWYGLSLGSVLLLAAIGLAITFGVMGVINMAHGEMVMLGAYTTYVVQQTVALLAPGLATFSLAFAVPIAFLFTGLVGVAIERGIIRFLYGRPLETLLATWGLSLILQQTIRTIFGPTNRQVDNPSWMSGTFDFGGLAITWNRMWIIVFSLAVFLALLTLLKRSRLGLQMRAVTQNRRMASSMGIRTPMVDAMTFGLGSGIAGIAGVALSQIDNVSPNLGQNYIIDSFMVVVFGGVGNLWGTFVGAMTLGIANKFLEPYAGAVLGKILILVLIILFIQRRPRGLFALKGRSIE
ncbi:amino acid/amide ABC transporter membrane protein 1 (HAAT family) [Rhizobium sp. PP-F2F-G48]|uniref:urea ABC transporter permease subunit UrtB n=1 Tax=Rhizobium sp. PP-F2F-G48 TaxID=2135651 RepID=UPI00104F20B7|nr:urea ABC transporter permease subunit UrtB [Rhizobium sp. PP-F2F-G48]TCM58294.1 amino acid/amide ABC transporter membrane protein 1 (HAAT family) [Rhizobium sp. PP-F2F-G48]